MRAVLLSVSGRECNDLLTNLVRPAKPKDKTYDELYAALGQYVEPNPLEIMERFRFSTFLGMRVNR